MAVNSSSGRHSCLIVLPSCKEGMLVGHMLLGYDVWCFLFFRKYFQISLEMAKFEYFHISSSFNHFF